MNKATVTVQKEIIPTYPVGKPNRNPMFLDKRVYQGSSGRVYPHSVIDSVADEKADREYTAIYLENEFICIMVLPEIGGRIHRAYDKTNGYDFIYYNRVIKPAMVGLNGPWISGGIEFNWPQHHRPSTFDPVSYAVRENDNGSASVILGEVENMFRTRGVTTITVYPGKAYVEVTSRLYNRTAQPQTFLWWANPAVSANEHTQSVFPPDVYAVMDHGRRDVSDFPIAHGTYYKVDYSAGVDISRYKNIPVPTSYMACHSDYDFIGHYDHGRKAGLLHVADHHISPGKKQWTWGTGAFGKAWERNLTDADGPYIELMTGCFTDNQPDFSYLMPEEEKCFSQYFMPYKGIGMVKNATTDAAVSFDVQDAMARFAVYATAIFQAAVIKVSRDGIALYEKSADLGPNSIFEDELKVPDGPLKIMVSDGSGKCLVSYTHHQAAETKPDMPKAARAIPEPAKVETNEELYLYGLHIQQYRHATRNAEDYYLEGLRRDPTDLRQNNAYGKALMERGRFQEAAEHFQKAIDKLTLKNPNPYDGEPFFNLGIALTRLDRLDQAYDAFFKSTWNAAYKAAGFYRVGAIDIRRGDEKKALDHLIQGQIANWHSLKTRNARTALLRKIGQSEQAQALAMETINIDPLDAFSLRERALLAGGEDLEWVRILNGNANTYIETALDYAEMGFEGEACAVLNQYISLVGDPKQVYPMVYYHLGVFSGEEDWFRLAEEACTDYCFPHRLEDMHALEAAIASKMPNARAEYYLGNLLYDRREAQRAILHWEAAVQKRDDLSIPRRNLALAYYNTRHDAAQAIAHMHRALELAPEDARLFMEYDQLLKKTGMDVTDRLRGMLLRMDLVMVRDDLMIEYLALLNHTGEYEKALEVLSRHRFHPWEGGEGKSVRQWRTALMLLAKRAMEQNGPQTAIRHLTAAGGDYPENLGEGKLPGAPNNDVFYLLGCAYEMMGDMARAEEMFERASLGCFKPVSALYYNDQPPQMIYYQGMAHKKLGRTQEAASLFGMLEDYANAHMDEHVVIDFFAVSLPDLAIFHDDLDVRNRLHCMFMLYLSHMGKGNVGEAETIKAAVLKADPSHEIAVFIP